MWFSFQLKLSVKALKTRYFEMYTCTISPIHNIYVFPSSAYLWNLAGRCRIGVHWRWGVPWTPLTWAAHLALQNAATTEIRSWRNTGKNPSQSLQDGGFVLKEPNLPIWWFSSFHHFSFIIFFLPSDILSKSGTENDPEFAGTLCCLQQSSVSHDSVLEKQGHPAWASPVDISIGQEEIRSIFCC